MKYVKIKDILACCIFLLFLPVVLVSKIFIRDFWLVGEEKQEARDNGYWFFKWVRENRPNQKIAYVIDKKCSDYAKVKNLGKIVQWGSFSHWFWYLVAKKNISSQKGCKPNAAACYLFEVKLRLWRNKRYFLQHGITKDNAVWLYYKNCRFNLFVCGAKPEFEYIRSNFGYPQGAVQELGFCRFDGLIDTSADKKVILVMPTWRSSLVRSCIGLSEPYLKKEFIKSVYFTHWIKLLNNSELSEILETYGYVLMFYPHRNMQRFLDCFKETTLPERVQIADPTIIDVQTALKESACLITDYSSVFFDFAYMRKPILFYQFDESDYRQTQYKEGYFDYHNNPLGKWADNDSTVVNNLKSIFIERFEKNSDADYFFSYHDKNNCERNYKAVKTL